MYFLFQSKLIGLPIDENKSGYVKENALLINSLNETRTSGRQCVSFWNWWDYALTEYIHTYAFWVYTYVCILRKTYYGTCILRNMYYGLWIGQKLIERKILRDCSSWHKYWVWNPVEVCGHFFSCQILWENKITKYELNRKVHIFSALVVMKTQKEYLFSYILYFSDFQ